MTTIKDLFNTVLPDAIAKNVAKAKQAAGVFHFKVEGSDGGNWTVDTKASSPTVASGLSGTPDCTVQVTSKDLSDIIANPMLGMKYFFEGKLKVTGDAMKINQIIALTK